MTRRNNKRRNDSSVSVPAAVEAMEPRLLLSATLSASGIWTITGTNASDEIFIGRDEANRSMLYVEVNRQEIDYQPADKVSQIIVLGRRGNDYIEIGESAGAIAIPALLRGQEGNDTIIGGSGNDLIRGEAGNDRLEGRNGNDTLEGSGGDDYLSGGFGVDLLYGGSGKNTIVDEPNDNPPGDDQNQIVKVRVPAEWEAHDSTWMQWPKGEETSYRENFAGIIRALQAYEQVNIAVETSAMQAQAAQFLQQRGVPLTNIQFQIMPYDWSWMRDNGAIWVEQTTKGGQQKLAVQDWGFDGWGGEGGPSRKDDAVPQHVARIENVDVEKVSVVLEKGTLEFNGKDTLITSWPVLNNRNPNMTRGQLEVVLKAKFGVSKVVWLEAKPTGDITNGHVDGIARFINENTVVVSRYANQSDPDSPAFEQSAAIIRAAGLNVVRMDIPGYVNYRNELLPANYTNYLVANGVVIASSYGNAQFDNNARQQLQQLFPTRTIVLTDTRELWYNGGAVHCVTNDQPLSLRTAAARSSSISQPPVQAAQKQSTTAAAPFAALPRPDSTLARLMATNASSTETGSPEPGRVESSAATVTSANQPPRYEWWNASSSPRTSHAIDQLFGANLMDGLN